MNKLNSLLSNFSARFFLSLMMLSSGSLFAQALPTTAPPSRGEGSDGNFIKLLQGYSYDVLIFAGLLVSSVTLFIVVKNVVGTYSEITDGKATWGQVGMHAGVGVMLLVLTIFLLTEASKIL